MRPANQPAVTGVVFCHKDLESPFLNEDLRHL